MIEVLTPASTMMQQSEGQWMKYLGLVLKKLAPDGVTITLADLEEMANGEELTVLVHGHKESIEFKLVTKEQAEVLVAHDRTISGNA